LKEWLSYYQSVLENEQKYKEELHTLMELVFEIFDQNEDGKISEAEWEQLFSIYNICPIYAAEVFQKLDQNQDGSLDRSEVMDLIYHFFYSDNPDHPANRMFGPY
jgi:Ca2+-binding EF-hand superfamily protein